MSSSYILNIYIENGDVLEFEQCVSNSNIAKIECMKFSDKQITLSMISMFVAESKAIKRHKNLTRFTQLRLHPPVCSISYIIKGVQRTLKYGELQ